MIGEVHNCFLVTCVFITVSNMGELRPVFKKRNFTSNLHARNMSSVLVVNRETYNISSHLKSGS